MDGQRGGRRDGLRTDSYSDLLTVHMSISEGLVCASPQGQQQPGWVFVCPPSRTISSVQ
jgi:hypothetical protein